LTRASRASRILAGLPPHACGQRIGLQGGSFDPPHAGHRQAALIALRRLGLDQVWWVVTPGNPLKAWRAGSLAERMHKAAAVAAHPKIVVTGVEAEFGTRYTADFIARLKARSPCTRFVWLMGSDNLLQFHRWERWREIATMAPIAVINRPGSLAAPLTAVAAQTLARFRLDGGDALRLASAAPPAWLFLVGPRTSASSTALRGPAAAS
jgi:nicotinate-nucleotide adenylyltransferase